MTTEQIIAGLELQRDKLRNDCERQMLVLQDAIDFLRVGGTPATSPEPEATDNDRSVASFVREAIRSIGVENGFDTGAVRAECLKLFPDNFAAIKRGMYNVITKLKSGGEIIPCPGGKFQATSKLK